MSKASPQVCTPCAGKVTNKGQPYEVIREDLTLIGQTRKPTFIRERRPAPSHVAGKARAKTPTRTSDASSLSTALHSLWVLAFPGPTGFQVCKIK